VYIQQSDNTSKWLNVVVMGLSKETHGSNPLIVK